MKMKIKPNWNRIYTWVMALVLVLVLVLYQSKIFYRLESFATNETYTIEEIPNFLSPEECNHMMELSKNQLRQSQLFRGTDVEDLSVRRSKQAWLQDQDDPVLAQISQRIAQRTKTNVSDQESLQVVKYDTNGFYKPHFDACNKKVGDDCERMNLGKGPRYMTVLMYLNDDFEGGGTFFPELNQTVIPQTGKAVIFYNVDRSGDVIPKAIHGGLDVTRGEKWIANKWIHRQL